MKAAYANLTATTEATVKSQMTATSSTVTTFNTELTSFIGKWNKFFSVSLSLSRINHFWIK